MKKHIVRFGDSNTHGYCADPADTVTGGDRFDETERWTCLLQKKLGEEYLVLAAAGWSCMLQSRFSYRFGELTANALRFLPVHLLPSIAVGGLGWLGCWYCFHYPIGLTFAPAVIAIGWSLAAEPVFAKYGGGLKTQ